MVNIRGNDVPKFHFPAPRVAAGTHLPILLDAIWFLEVYEENTSFRYIRTLKTHFLWIFFEFKEVSKQPYSILKIPNLAIDILSTMSLIIFRQGLLEIEKGKWVCTFGWMVGWWSHYWKRPIKSINSKFWLNTDALAKILSEVSNCEIIELPVNNNCMHHASLTSVYWPHSLCKFQIALQR